jgi:hypothetical protein
MRTKADLGASGVWRLRCQNSTHHNPRVSASQCRSTGSSRRGHCPVAMSWAHHGIAGRAYQWARCHGSQAGCVAAGLAVAPAAGRDPWFSRHGLRSARQGESAQHEGVHMRAERKPSGKLSNAEGCKEGRGRKGRSGVCC